MTALLLTLFLLLVASAQAQDGHTHSAPLPHADDTTTSSSGPSAPDLRPQPAPTLAAANADVLAHEDPLVATTEGTDHAPGPPASPSAGPPSTAPVPAREPLLTPTPVVIELAQPAAPTPRAAQPHYSDPTYNLAANLLPRPPKPNLLRALLLLLATLACVGLANLAERPLGRLAAHGFLPGSLKIAVVVCRSGALLVAFLGLLHMVPAAWSPAVAYVLVGTALAVGWSVREVVQDVLVGLIFTLERSFRAGQRLSFGGVTGTLTRMTFRVTWLRTDEGADIAIPNRTLTSATLELDPEPYAPVSVLLLVPPCRPSVEARNTIRELVLLNPYLAPGEDPQVFRQADDPQRWRVKARLLDARYADRFRGTMVDLVEEVFGPPQGPCEHDAKP